jgi:hypothetical protein
MIWEPLLNAHLTNGDFLAAEQEDNNLLSICQVINVLYPNELRATTTASDVFLSQEMSCSPNVALQ